MAERFSQFKAVCIKGTAKERAIVRGAMAVLNNSYCRAETALQFLEGVAARMNHCRIIIKCVGDYTYTFDSSAQTNEPNDWSDEFLAKPFLVEVSEEIPEYDDYEGIFVGYYTRKTLKGFADELSAKLHSNRVGGRLVNPITGLTTTSKKLADKARELRRAGMNWSDAHFVARFFIVGTFFWTDKDVDRFHSLIEVEMVEFSDPKYDYWDCYYKYYYKGVLVGESD